MFDITDEAAALKQQLRQKHLALRRQLSLSERLHKDSLIAQKLARFLVNTAPKNPQPLRLGIYIPFFDETDPFLEVFQILEENRIRYEPYVPMFKRRPRKLMFVCPTSLPDFKYFFRACHHTDVWVTPSPAWSSQGSDSISCWIIPGVCFSTDGYRIGYGTGFYDTYLANQKGLFIGIAYDVQVTPVPFDPHPTDIPMNLVLTERDSHHRSLTGATS